MTVIGLVLVLSIGTGILFLRRESNASSQIVHLPGGDDLQVYCLGVATNFLVHDGGLLEKFLTRHLPNLLPSKFYGSYTRNSTLNSGGSLGFWIERQHGLSLLSSAVNGSLHLALFDPQTGVEFPFMNRSVNFLTSSRGPGQKLVKERIFYENPVFPRDSSQFQIHIYHREPGKSWNQITNLLVSNHGHPAVSPSKPLEEEVSRQRLSNHEVVLEKLEWRLPSPVRESKSDANPDLVRQTVLHLKNNAPEWVPFEAELKSGSGNGAVFNLEPLKKNAANDPSASFRCLPAEGSWSGRGSTVLPDKGLISVKVLLRKESNFFQDEILTLNDISVSNILSGAHLTFSNLLRDVTVTIFPESEAVTQGAENQVEHTKSKGPMKTSVRLHLHAPGLLVGGKILSLTGPQGQPITGHGLDKSIHHNEGISFIIPEGLAKFDLQLGIGSVRTFVFQAANPVPSLLK